MSRPLRLEYPGALYHVSSRGNERRNIFRDDTDRIRFLDYLAKSVDMFGWIVTAYVLMSNHFHFVVELTEANLADGMRWLNSKYARAFNSRHERVGHLYQGRYNAPLIDKEHYGLRVLRYVVLNPVRAGMVKTPEEYKWSSYRATIGAIPAPDWLAVDDALWNFGRDRETAQKEYRQFVQAGIAIEDSPFDDLVGGLYLGSEEWMDRVKEELHRKPRPDDHPRAQREPDERTMADVIKAVAETYGINEQMLRLTRGGEARTLAAWLGRHEARLGLRAIAAGLRVRSIGHVSNVIRLCDRQMKESSSLQKTAGEITDRLYLSWKTVKPKL